MHMSIASPAIILPTAQVNLRRVEIIMTKLSSVEELVLKNRLVCDHCIVFFMIIIKN